MTVCVYISRVGCLARLYHHQQLEAPYSADKTSSSRTSRLGESKRISQRCVRYILMGNANDNHNRRPSERRAQCHLCLCIRSTLDFIVQTEFAASARYSVSLSPVFGSERQVSTSQPTSQPASRISLSLLLIRRNLTRLSWPAAWLSETPRICMIASSLIYSSSPTSNECASCKFWRWLFFIEVADTCSSSFWPKGERSS